MIKCECLHHDLIFFVTTSIFGNKNNVSLKTTGHASWDLSRNEVNTPSGEQGNTRNIMIPTLYWGQVYSWAHLPVKLKAVYWVFCDFFLALDILSCISTMTFHVLDQ